MWWPTARGGNLLVCTVHRSASFMCLFLRASSVAARVSLQVGWGMLRPGSMSMKSLIGKPNTHWAGDSFVTGSGVFQYWSMARCRALVFRLLCGSVLLVMSRWQFLMPISALQFECGCGTDDRWWCTPQSFRKRHVTDAVNLGQPSVAHSSRMPNVPNMRCKQSIRPLDSACACSMMGQFQYLSSATR